MYGLLQVVNPKCNFLFLFSIEIRIYTVENWSRD